MGWTEMSGHSKTFVKALLQLGWDGFGSFKNPKIYLVWSHERHKETGEENRRLRAICTNSEKAETYKEAVQQEGGVTWRWKLEEAQIVERDLNHLYSHCEF